VSTDCPVKAKSSRHDVKGENASVFLKSKVRTVCYLFNWTNPCFVLTKKAPISKQA